MSLSWPIIFVVLFLGFAFIPGVVFLSHKRGNNKKESIEK